MKACTKCKNELALSEFYHCAAKQNYSAHCKSCARKRRLELRFERGLPMNRFIPKKETEKIIMLRKDYNLTYQQIADQYHVTRQAIHLKIKNSLLTS